MGHIVPHGNAFQFGSGQEVAQTRSAALTVPFDSNGAPIAWHDTARVKEGVVPGPKPPATIAYGSRPRCNCRQQRTARQRSSASRASALSADAPGERPSTANTV